ncbi:MAG: hypothetical protein KJ057_03640 [Phycisphaerae bacterium]|nr:MAG: hypothetical protein F9K17_05290 [Phycisphaerae bacterium]MBE7457743.1 hypothetical protein [Planctomycetia bacterium]MCK6463738.1 hypothetical protein [Phycisphaerae bacterium]MCL4717547.1 hypothetical protein [Phycisphaerae bacterium]NUQ08434.1 hypothetical protein [Phycisphaerae bacterium]
MNAPPSTSSCPARTSLGRRVLRTLYFIFVAYPYGLVSLPLATFLIWHLIRGDEALVEHLRRGSLKEALQCGAVIAAITVFALLAVTHFAMTMYTGWRESARRR